jgi:RNA polymerase sigma-70 factor (ECF subfamily)
MREGDTGVSYDDLRAREFTAFFNDVSQSLFAQAYALTGDVQDAKDLVQESLARAWRRWDRVAGYDNKEAWVRTVLHRLAVGRWRQLQTRRRHEGRPEVGDDSGDCDERLDLVRALGTLPVKQRRALVLHDLVGLTAAEVATEMGASPETVRVWLHRGRQALARQLAWHNEPTSNTSTEVTGDARSRNA